jgi:hypothetical protein
MTATDLRVFTKEDEGAHPVGEEESWQESLVIVWLDRDSGIGGSHRIGHEVNRNSANAWCGVMTDEGVRFRANPTSLPLLSEDRAVDHFSAGGYAFDFNENGGSYTVDTTDCRLELAFEDFYAPCDAWDRKHESTVGSNIGVANHFEVAGRVTGKARLGNRTFQVDGLCQRDHSWGPRDWSKSAGTRWCSGSCGPDLSFTGTIAQGMDYNVLKGGMVVRDGEVTPADDVDACVLLEPDGMSFRGATVTWELRDGSRLELTAEPLDQVVFNIHQRVGQVDGICRVADGEGHEGFCDMLVWNGLRRSAPIRSSFGANYTEGLSFRPQTTPKAWPMR